VFNDKLSLVFLVHRYTRPKIVDHGGDKDNGVESVTLPFPVEKYSERRNFRVLSHGIFPL